MHSGGSSPPRSLPVVHSPQMIDQQLAELNRRSAEARALRYNNVMQDASLKIEELEARIRRENRHDREQQQVGHFESPSSTKPAQNDLLSQLQTVTTDLFRTKELLASSDHRVIVLEQLVDLQKVPFEQRSPPAYELEFTRLRAVIEKACASEAIYKSEIQKLAKEAQDLRTELEMTKHLLAERSFEISEYRLQTEKAEGERRLALDASTTLAREVNNLRKDYETIMIDNMKKHEELEKKTDGWEKMKKSHGDKLNETETSLKESKERLQQTLTTCANLVADLDHVRAELQQALSEKKRIEDDLHVCKSQLNSCVQASSTLSRELDAVRQDLIAANNSLKSKENSITQLVQSQEKMEASHRYDIEILICNNNELRREIESFKTHCIMWETRYNEAVMLLSHKETATEALQFTPTVDVLGTASPFE